MDHLLACVFEEITNAQLFHCLPQNDIETVKWKIQQCAKEGCNLFHLYNKQLEITEEEAKVHRMEIKSGQDKQQECLAAFSIDPKTHTNLLAL